MRRRLVAALVGAAVFLVPAIGADIAQAKPVNSYPPEVVGAPAVGERILCGGGTWVGIPSKFTFEWIREGVQIASGVAYTVKREDEGYRLWCVVTAYEGSETTEVESANSVLIPPPPQSTPPAPALPGPAISGVPRVNESLACSTGEWRGSRPLTFTYQWVRDPGPTETLVAGATASTYTIASGDQGHLLACRVTAHNSAGSASSLSNELEVPGVPPILEIAPQVFAPNPRSGEAVTCTNGKWTGSPKPTFAFQWLREGAAIAGATGSVYTLQPADELSFVSCRVTATNSAGSAEATSSNSVRVLGTKPGDITIPSIVGTPAVGNTLACEPGEWTGNPKPTFSFAWVRNRGILGGEPAGTGREYTVVEADSGKTLSCVVTAKGEGEASEASEAVLVKAPGLGTAPEDETPPSVHGERRVEAILTCEPGTWSGTPAPQLTYQWLRGGVAIAGATSSTYHVAEADATQSVACRVTATNTVGMVRAESESVFIPGVAPFLREQPHVTGSAELGELITCLGGRWGGAPKPTLTYQWLRNEMPIPDATSSVYLIGGEDRGTQLKCEVTATNSIASAKAVSPAVQVPGNQPRNLTLPEITGRKEVGAKLKCLPGTWSGNPTPVFTYQWLVGGSEIPAATGESYTVIAAQQGLVISCRVTATNPEGSASAESNGVSVPGIKPESVEAPQVSGSPVVGSSLKCGPGLWNGKPPPTFSFQWLRDGVAIAAATAQTYTVELADQGHSLSCTVRATNGEGSAEAHSSNALAVPVPVVLNEPKHELVVPLVTPPPTASEIQHTLRVQLARMLHHVHLASLRKSASFVFPFVAPSAGKLELFWYQANNSASQASGRQVVLALATSSFSGVGAKNVKLVLTAVARRMLRATKRVPLSFKGVFMLPGAPRVTWSGSYLLSH